VAGGLHDTTPTGGVSAEPSGFEVNKALRQEHDRALLRARIALALLQLAGATDLEKVTTALQKATRAPDVVAEQDLRRELRFAWQRHQREQPRRPQ
jgi:hypothetical protein